MKRAFVDPLYERIWHWVLAASASILLATGAAIHWPEAFRLLPFDKAVAIHAAMGFVLLANGFLGLFFYLTTGEILQFLPGTEGFLRKILRQVRYYLQDIFRGEPQPFIRTRGERLNPLQRITYLAILNVLLPIQIVTGVLIWGIQNWLGAESPPGGLALPGALHTLGAWLFAAFLIGHLYLITMD